MAHQFGSTWWGRAWVDALEHRAGLDPNRLPRGRTYARQDRVNRVELEPGKVTALVRGSRVLPYKVTIGVRTFDDATWTRFAMAVARRAGHAAALLDGEIDPGVLADAREVDVDLMPGPGDLHPRCSCPDWADPCKHSAAVCYLVADALDDDPFLLFALRGRTRDALLAEVREQRRAGVRAASVRARGHGPGGMGGRSGDGGALVDPGVVAREAWATEPGPLPHRPELPAAPGHPAAWPADPPADAPFTADGLQRLAADAAARAWAQLAEGAPSGLLLGPSADLARRAAALVAADEPLTDLARAAGETTLVLANRAAAWRHAGEEGLAAVDEALWRPSAEVVAAGIRAFEDIGADPEAVQVRSNRITLGDVQLRVTEDGRWWRYEKRGRSWDLVEPPAPAPDDLVSGD